jgi:hypothetical protein
MLKRFIAIGLMISIPAFAADNCDQQVIDQDIVKDLQQVSSRMNVECPNSVNASDLCDAVSGQVLETDSRQTTRYTFQTKILRASCVETSDSPEIVQAKVQNFWNKYHDKLNCSQINFTIRNGHILKLAVERNSRDFINDAVRKWKVNLNHVDPADQKTVLDYIESELTKSRGTSLEPVLQRYFTLFRTNGAKHKREL